VSAFDDQDTDKKTTEHPAKRIAAKAIELAKAHPFPAAAVGAFVAFGIFAFVVALFRPVTPVPVAPSAPAIAVPSSPTPASSAPVPAAAAPAISSPPPAAGLGAGAAAPPPAVTGPVVLPVSLPLEAPAARGASITLSLDQDTNQHDERFDFIELTAESLTGADAAGALDFPALRERFSSMWPGRNDVQAQIKGLIRIENAGLYTVQVTMNELSGMCSAAIGPTTNRVVEVDGRFQRQAVGAGQVTLEPGMYQSVFQCTSRATARGSASLSLREAGGQPRLAEFWVAEEEAP